MTKVQLETAEKLTTVTIKTTWHNAGPHTVWGKLAAKLGREPTNEEANAEVFRIFDEARANLAAKGKLPHQRKR